MAIFHATDLFGWMIVIFPCTISVICVPELHRPPIANITCLFDIPSSFVSDESLVLSVVILDCL